MSDESLDERLANRRKPSDPDYDAFYDATDSELAAMLPPVKFGDDRGCAAAPWVHTTLPEMRSAADAGEFIGEFYDRLAGGSR